jgi:WD40 repeat protein
MPNRFWKQTVLAGSDLVWNKKKNCRFGLALQYDDRKIVTGSSDQHIAIWDIRTGELLSKIQAHEYATARSWVRTLARSAKVFFLKHSDGALCWLPVPTNLCREPRTCVFGLPQHAHYASLYRSSAVLHLGFDDQNVISCSKDFKIKVWTVDEETMTLKLKFVIAAHEAPVNVVQFDKR